MTKRAFALLLALVTCAGAAACRSAPAGPPGDVGGTWNGSWRSNWGFVLPVVLTLQQAGEKVTGQMESASIYTGGPVEGDVRGRSVSLKAAGTFPALRLELDGDEMTGSFGSVGGGVNSITLRRQR